MRPSFVVAMAALILLGTPAAMVIAAAGEVADGLAQRGQSRRLARVVTNTAATLVAIQFAGAVHLSSAGRLDTSCGRGRRCRLRAAVIAYCVGRGTTGNVVVPLLTRRPIDPEWAPHVLASCAPHAVGAALAVALAEAIAHGQWALLLVAAVPAVPDLPCVSRLPESPPRGASSARGRGGDGAGHGRRRPQRCRDGLERGRCPGCWDVPPTGAGTVAHRPPCRRLAGPDLPAIVDEVLTHRHPRTLARVALPSAAGPGFSRCA